MAIRKTLGVFLAIVCLCACAVEEDTAPATQAERDAALRESILATPVRLGVSLEKRYRPRLRACRLAGADERKVLTLASWPDDRFCSSIGVSVDDLAACSKAERLGAEQ